MHKIFFLIDDDPDDIAVFKETLAKSKVDVTLEHAYSGKSAVNLLKNSFRKPDIIFLDIHMPDMNGWECLEMIKAEPTLLSIPVIMYSVSDKKSDSKLALDHGAIGLLTKPNDYKKLIELLSEIAEVTKEGLLIFLQKKTINYL